MKILEQEVELSQELEAYNQYRLSFQQEADKAKELFSQLYQKNSSLKEVILRVPEQAAESMHSAIMHCIQILVKHGILDVDAEQFSQTYFEVNNFWNEPYMKVCDQYAAIVMNEKELDEYRVARRKYRSRWQGGGFGLTGAVKGAATAGALNMITGAGHMLVNGMGKVVSSIASNAEMNRIFRDPSTLSSIAEGVWASTFELHLALLDCLRRYDREQIAINGIINEASSRSASAILKNLSLLAGDEKRRAAMLQSFLLDPYQHEWYRIALELFGDKDGQLESAAEHFGVSVVRQEKERIINNFAATLPLDSEESAQLAQLQIQKFCTEIHYFGQTEKTKQIDAAVTYFDEIYRTVDGILLPSREEADCAKKELRQIQEILQAVDYSSLFSIETAEKKIAHYHSLVAQQKSEVLHQRWIELDFQLRTANTHLSDGSTILCETQKQAEELQAMANVLHECLEDCGVGTSAEQALLVLKEQLEKERGFPQLVSLYKKEIDHRLQEIDLTYRTALGTVYSTRDDASKATALYQEIKQSLSDKNVKENAPAIRMMIENATFPDVITQELAAELFQKEHASELRTAKKLSTISTVLLLGMVVFSVFSELSAGPTYVPKSITLFGEPILIGANNINPDLNFWDGLKNGIVIFGRVVEVTILEIILDYVGGFGSSIVQWIIWAFVGLIIVPVKYFLLAIPRYLITTVLFFLQRASIGYYVGYIISVSIPYLVAQFSFDETKPEENVEQLKKIKRILGRK